MKLTLFYISLISCAILFSCEKDPPVIVEKNVIPLLSKVLVNGVTFSEYSYNNENMISEEKNKFSYIKHNYNSKNLFANSDFYYDFSLDSMQRKVWVNSQNTEKSLSKVFEYIDNEKLRIIYTRPSGNNSEFSDFTFKNNRVIKQTMYWENKISGHIDYLYDEAGNLIKKIKYVLSAENEELITTTDYEYDNMQNPYKSFKKVLDPGINTNQNNITKETYVIQFDVAASIQKVQITENSYTYNAKGYPIKANGNIEYKYL